MASSGVFTMIYIIRHGQTEKNRANLLQGRSDIPLNEAGKQQAAEAAERFRAGGITFDRVYTSHLTRAIQTAAAILTAQHAETTMEILPELAECGDRDHVAQTETLQALYPRMAIHGLASRPFENDAARAAWCLQTCVYDNAYAGELPVTGQTSEGEQRENDLRVLIVCHGMFNAHLIGQLVNFPFDKNVVISQYNACINRFQLYTVGGVRRVRFRCFNSTAHLPEDLLT